jgi:hypothetical protein
MISISPVVKKCSMITIRHFIYYYVMGPPVQLAGRRRISVVCLKGKLGNHQQEVEEEEGGGRGKERKLHGRSSFAARKRHKRFPAANNCLFAYTGYHKTTARKRKRNPPASLCV